MRLFAFFAFLVLLGVAAAAVTLPGSSGPSYSAVYMIGGPGPAEGGRVYHDDGKERLELFSLRGLRIYIRRPDLGQVFIINPHNRTGKALPIDHPRADFGFWRLRDLPAEAQEQETMDGETVTKYVAIDRYNKPQGYWLTGDGIPLQVVRTAGIETVTIRLIDLQRGSQPAHLFEVPDDIEMTVNPEG